MNTIISLLADAHKHKGPSLSIAVCRRRGAEDCRSGVPSDYNPFPVGSPEFCAWRDGYMGEWDRQLAIAFGDNLRFKKNG